MDTQPKDNLTAADYAIIVAGGKGLRMGGGLPKQFIPVGGLPILMHTIRRFRAWSERLKIVLVLPREQQDYWCGLCRQYSFGAGCLVADGGETRFHSVKNGLALIPDGARGVVGVHDGVRPFVGAEVISRCYEAARRTGAAVPVVPVVETLRRVGGGTVPRDGYRLVQTPQAFGIGLLKSAYARPYSDSFTDDASVAESAGHTVTLVEGNRENIKITTPFDLTVAEALLRQEAGGRGAD